MTHAKAFAASGNNEEPGDLSVASQKCLFAVGMVCCDEEGGLKELAIKQASDMTKLSPGKMVTLDVAVLQVIGIRGHNTSGHCLMVSEIIDHVPLSYSSDKSSEPEKKQALDRDFIQTDLSHVLPEISVSPFDIHLPDLKDQLVETRGSFPPFGHHSQDFGVYLGAMDQTQLKLHIDPKEFIHDDATPQGAPKFEVDNLI
ncbi:hypothetical protein OROMI_023716 [Orobanche minor]